MGHRHHGAWIVVQEALQPGHGLGVQVVGRLVEQQQVGALQQQPAERDAPPLAAGELGDVGVTRRAAQGVHGDLDRAVQVPGVGRVDLLLQLGLLGDQVVHLVVRELLAEAQADLVEAVEQRLGLGHALHDVAGDVLVGIELRFLRQEADLGALGRPGLAVDVALQPGHDPKQRRLAGTVEAQHADLGARKERQPDVLQDLPAARKDLPQALHDVDVLVRGHVRFALAYCCDGRGLARSGGKGQG